MPLKGGLPPHKAKHQTGGDDEVSIASLAGSPAQKAAASGLASLSAGSLVVQKPADRLGLANLEFTANKLVLGAGAGANPTEINVPAAATIVSKPANEIVNNSTVLQNDDHLFFAVGALERWEVLLALEVRSTTATPDVKYAWSVPSGAIKKFLTWSETAPSPNIDGTATAVLAADNAERWTMIRYLVVSGATAGNVQLQWAQNTATAEDTRVVDGSFLIAHRVQ